MKKLLIIIRQFFVPVAFVFIAASFTGAYYSDSVASTNNTITAATWSVSPANIVINEFMANPVESDESNYEWVELMNTGGSSINIDGWVLYDEYDSHALVISSSNVAGGSTIVSPGGYAVVGRNGDIDFSLNNGGDTIRLYNDVIGIGSQIDNISYPSTIEDKTWARTPNGTGTFTDGHDQTAGGPNV